MAPLPPRRSRRGLWIAAAAAVAVVAAGVIVAVVAGGDDGKDGGDQARTVRIGVADASEPYWKTYADLAKQQLNVTVSTSSTWRTTTSPRTTTCSRSGPPRSTRCRCTP
ncbi:hypothetical protein ACQP2F_12875 [Actinoplanes sp. CA-030573]|uniref:hypothetical protein n=1 Tax=Actinoplanes sp. CA-030573 TaxID=3239898 RepID=UPI003D92CFB3